MKRVLLIFIVIIAVISPQTVSAIDLNLQDDGKLIAQEVYQFPSYQQSVEKTDVEKYATKVEYENAVDDKNFEFSKLTYLSDSLKVKAYLYKPKRLNTKLPVIIFNRGSFVRGDIPPELIAFFHRLALEGFCRSCADVSPK